MRVVAQAEVLPRFRNLAAGDISQKSGPQDLVTEADLEAERHLTELLQELEPDTLILGEEAVSAQPGLRARIGGAARAIILDPVDGTWNFANDLALFGMILAVSEQGVPVAGAILDPILDDWLEVSKGAGAWMKSPDRAARKLSVSDEKTLKNLFGFVHIGHYEPERRAALVNASLSFRRIHMLRCAAHEYRLMAQGRAEFCLSGQVPHPWDHATGALAVVEAGGVARFLDGGEYTLGRKRGILLCAASEEVWQQVAGIYQPILL